MEQRINPYGPQYPDQMVNIDCCRGVIFRKMEYRVLSICKLAANVTINGFGVTDYFIFYKLFLYYNH